MSADELPKEEAERRAREVAQRMLTTPKPKKDEVSRKRQGAMKQRGKAAEGAR
jgi:hypothetical protein